ncbi:MULTISPECIES: asparagine synthase C-terminal domain-containing protein [unclassified Bacillus (in: firmicutes)]|uniref:asparagine synthase C-terminal domain-containing protein n=1 Tax=unclassified Bacillus (in: firmicutes) TaxID=185979 RepID=UPI002FFE2A42
MFYEVRITNNRLIKEISVPFGHAYFGGYVIYQGKYYHQDNIQDILEANFFEKHLQDLIGEFVFIQADQNGITAIVDRKRSIPLFYYKEGSRWIVTDKIAHQQDRMLQKTAAKEFILTGFTANEKTLYEEVYQIEAGSYLQIDEAGTVDNHEYYQFYHHPENKELEQFSEELQAVFHEVFNDLIKRLINKVPILPLSGGYDSRIIAILLKEYGIEHIASFTYGKRENKEAQVSRDIAKRLGLKWDFIEYKKDDWHRWYHSQEWKDYVDFAVNGSSMAHLQDWPAVREIVTKQDADYVFIPGHSGDFVAGSHLAYEITVDREFTADDVVQFNLNKHHKLWEMGQGLHSSATDVIAEMKRSFKDLPYQTNEQASALFEYWDWRERQAKFIINSIRVYEFYEKGWDIPLWDDRLMEFFKTVPVEYRFKKYLYDYTLNKMYPDYFPEPVKPVGKETSLKQKYGVFYNTAKKLYNKKKLYQQYYTEPMEWYGIYKTYPEYVMALSFKHNGYKYSQPYNINSFLAKDYIQSLKGEFK